MISERMDAAGVKPSKKLDGKITQKMRNLDP
jgi:hypothetical protein